jgi:hypothetical protein
MACSPAWACRRASACRQGATYSSKSTVQAAAPTHNTGSLHQIHATNRHVRHINNCWIHPRNDPRGEQPVVGSGAWHRAGQSYRQPHQQQAERITQQAVSIGPTAVAGPAGDKPAGRGVLFHHSPGAQAHDCLTDWWASFPPGHCCAGCNIAACMSRCACATCLQLMSRVNAAEENVRGWQRRHQEMQEEHERRQESYMRREEQMQAQIDDLKVWACEGACDLHLTAAGGGVLDTRDMG